MQVMHLVKLQLYGPVHLVMWKVLVYEQCTVVKSQNSLYSFASKYLYRNSKRDQCSKYIGSTVLQAHEKFCVSCCTENLSEARITFLNIFWGIFLYTEVLSQQSFFLQGWQVAQWLECRWIWFYNGI
jgi:hypothetical protein